MAPWKMLHRLQSTTEYEAETFHNLNMTCAWGTQEPPFKNLLSWARDACPMWEERTWGATVDVLELTLLHLSLLNAQYSYNYLASFDIE